VKYTKAYSNGKWEIADLDAALAWHAETALGEFAINNHDCSTDSQPTKLRGWVSQGIASCTPTVCLQGGYHDTGKLEG
jgi:hypothetical protein